LAREVVVQVVQNDTSSFPHGCVEDSSYPIHGRSDIIFASQTRESGCLATKNSSANTKSPQKGNQPKERPMLTSNIRKLVTTTVFAAFALMATATFADEGKMAQTAAEHTALAKTYQDQAVSYHKVAADHRGMAEAYAKAHPDPKAGTNPWNAKMQKHCDMLAKDADKLATDSEKAAEFHTLRAKELQAK
jgi:hypothetical protein